MVDSPIQSAWRGQCHSKRPRRPWRRCDESYCDIPTGPAVAAAGLLALQEMDVCACGYPGKDVAVKQSRGDWIRTSGLLLPKQALCQAELHPALPVSLELSGLAGFYCTSAGSASVPEYTRTLPEVCSASAARRVPPLHRRTGQRLDAMRSWHLRPHVDHHHQIGINVDVRRARRKFNAP